MDGARDPRGIRRCRDGSGAVLYSAYCCSPLGRGHDVIRQSGPNQYDALAGRVSQYGFS